MHNPLRSISGGSGCMGRGLPAAHPSPEPRARCPLQETLAAACGVERVGSQPSVAVAAVSVTTCSSLLSRRVVHAGRACKLALQFHFIPTCSMALCAFSWRQARRAPAFSCALTRRSACSNMTVLEDT